MNLDLLRPYCYGGRSAAPTGNMYLPPAKDTLPFDAPDSFEVPLALGARPFKINSAPLPHGLVEPHTGNAKAFAELIYSRTPGEFFRAVLDKLNNFAPARRDALQARYDAAEARIIELEDIVSSARRALYPRDDHFSVCLPLLATHAEHRTRLALDPDVKHGDMLLPDLAGLIGGHARAAEARCEVMEEQIKAMAMQIKAMAEQSLSRHTVRAAQRRIDELEGLCKEVLDLHSGSPFDVNLFARLATAVKGTT